MEPLAVGKGNAVVLWSGLGFEQDVSSPCVFVWSDSGIACATHGAVVLGKCELKVGGRLGPGLGDGKEGSIFNLLLRWHPDCIEYSADLRQAEKLVFELGLEGAKSAVTPGIQVTRVHVEKDSGIDSSKISSFRASAACGNYLAADRFAVIYSAK